MGLFGGGNSESSSSTSVDIPTVTANQQGGSAPTIGALYLSSESGKKSKGDTTQALTVNVLDGGAVGAALANSGDAAARAAAITSQSIAELGAERANLVNLVAAFGQQSNRYADLSAGAAQAAADATAAADAAGERVGAVESLVESAKQWAWLVPLVGVGWYAFKR